MARRSATSHLPHPFHNMDSIYLERQEGQLCAQHCLNNLLQGHYFTAVDLAGFANELDEDEKERMAEGGVTNPDFLRFMQPSSNMDDSGFFSVQVIAKALAVWSLEMVPLSSPLMKQALESPTSQQAFICNHDYHWLTVRKLGHQWFNLNSLLKRPELISDTYLSLFLHQLQMEGYAIFVVTGSLPACEANDVLTLVRAEPSLPPPQPPRGGDSAHSTSSGKPQIQSKVPPQEREGHSGSKRHSESKAASHHSKYHRSESDQYCYVDEEKEEEDHALQMAMALSVSLQQSQEREDVDQQMRLHLDYGGDPLVDSNEGSGVGGGQDYGPEEEEAALTAAIYASLEEREEREQWDSIKPGGEESVASGKVSQGEQVLQVRPEEERAGEREGREEEGEREKREVEEQSGQEAGTGRETEVEVTGGDKEEWSREESNVALSQEELRIRRLKHLDQLPDS